MTQNSVGSIHHLNKGHWTSLMGNLQYLRDALNVGIYDPQLANTALSDKSPSSAIQAVRQYNFVANSPQQTSLWRLNHVFNQN